MPRIFRLPEDFPLPPEEIAKRIEENKALMLRLRKRRLSFKRIVLLLEHLNLPFKLAESYRNEDYYEKLMRKYGRVYKTAQKLSRGEPMCLSWRENILFKFKPMKRRILLMKK